MADNKRLTVANNAIHAIQDALIKDHSFLVFVAQPVSETDPRVQLTAFSSNNTDALEKISKYAESFTDPNAENQVKNDAEPAN